jgi:hypothetical protein
MKMTNTVSVPLLGLLMVLTGCQQNTAANQPPQVQAHSAAHPQGIPNPDPSVIPSVDGHKLRTTNEHGGTSYGLGSSVYSLIGSSGLHSGGFSSHLESRLSGEGMDGVKVFVFDDTVILAAETRQATASSYDAMQQKVLSNTGGQSGRGPEPGSPLGTLGSSGTPNDNLGQAEKRVKEFVGGDVKVLTVTGAEAVKAIERMRTAAGSSTLSPGTLSDDLRKLLNMAKDQGNK